MTVLFSSILVAMMLPLLVRSDTSTSALCSDMMAEFAACFTGNRQLEGLINEWKWGNIMSVFCFDFNSVAPEKQSACWVFAACPSSPITNHVTVFRDFPKVTSIGERDKPYLMFGAKQTGLSNRWSLVFVHCDKRSILYPLFLEYLKLCEPEYNKIQRMHPSKFWVTKIHKDTSFQGSRIDDYFVKWTVLDNGVDVVYRFNQEECKGIMLLKQDSLSSQGLTNTAPYSVEVLDLQRFSGEFRWVPDHQIERFNKYRADRIVKGKGNERIFNSIRANKVLNVKDNGDYVKQLCPFYGGGVETLISGVDIPWTEFSYHRSANYSIIVRGIVESCGFFSRERFDSFVLDVRGVDERTKVALPFGLDIKPYLDSLPSDNVLYEHIRCDNQCRIVVQPYIAYMYEGGHLVKVLVCSDEKGPSDHGWCLQRFFYNDGNAENYYWPVLRAYYPFDN